MTDMPTFIAFYTPQYQGESAAWVAALEKLRLPFFTELIEDKGSWRANCGHKPVWIKERLRIHGPVVWVDIDARVVAQPVAMPYLVESQFDFGAYFIPNRYMQSRDVPLGPDTGNDGIASGTMFFNATPGAYALLQAWIDHDHGQHYAEQFVLGEAWYRGCDGVRTARLPQAYCKVFDQPWRPGELKKEVIVHYQASRRLKRKVNQGAKR